MDALEQQLEEQLEAFEEKDGAVAAVVTNQRTLPADLVPDMLATGTIAADRLPGITSLVVRTRNVVADISVYSMTSAMSGKPADSASSIRASLIAGPERTTTVTRPVGRSSTSKRSITISPALSAR